MTSLLETCQRGVPAVTAPDGGCVGIESMRAATTSFESGSEDCAALRAMGRTATIVPMIAIRSRRDMGRLKERT
jgi:hypothetical protein